MNKIKKFLLVNTSTGQTTLKKTLRSTVKIMELTSGLHLASFAKNGAWMFISHITGMILVLATSYCFAHFLVPEEYGTYKYILSISGILGAFTLTGMNTSVTRAIASGNDGVYQSSIRYQLRWNLMVCIASLIPIIFFVISGNRTIAIALVIVSLATTLLTAFNTYTAFLTAKKQFKLLTTYTIIATITQTIAIISAIFLFKSALWIIIFSFISQATTAFIFHRKVRVHFPTTAFEDDATKTLRFGKILSLNNIIKLISDQADKFIIYSFLGPIQLAIYAFAQALPDQIRGVFKIVPSITLPHLAERKSNAIPTTFWKYFFILFLIVFGAVSAYNVLALPVFHLLFEPYLTSVPYSRVLSLSMIPIVLTIPLTTFLNARGDARASTVLNTTTAVIEISSLVIGGYLFGLWGVVFGKLIASSINFVIAIIILVRKNRLLGDENTVVEENSIYGTNL